MAETLTPRLGLIKPAKDTLTPLDIDRLNLNSDRLDKTQGALNVPDDFTPAVADMFDGLIVREKTSQKTWIAEKQTNGSFTKRWVKFPYFYLGFTPSGPVSASATWLDYGWTTLSGNSLNATVADRVATTNFWKAPFKGLWNIRYYDQFQPNGSTGQVRANVLSKNGVQDNINTETSHINNGLTTQANTSSYTRQLLAGDIIGHHYLIFQPGAAVNPSMYTTIEISCIERLD